MPKLPPHLSFPILFSQNELLNQIGMEENTEIKLLWLKILRLVARNIAIIFIIFILAMFIGEGGVWKFSSASIPLHTRDYIILSLWGLYVAGLLIGLWRERLGGLLSLVFMAINIIIFTIEGDKNLTNFYVLLLPSILYILSWYFHHRFARQP